MTKQEFLTIVKKLRLAYKRDGFLTDKESVELWYDMLGNLDYKILNHAAEKHIKNSQYQPTIADLYQGYKRTEEYISARKGELADALDTTRARYPEAVITDRARAAWDSIVLEPKSWAARLSKAEQIRQIVWTRVEDAERAGTINDLPDFETYMENLADELRSREGSNRIVID